MVQNLKALLVVLIVCLPALALARRALAAILPGDAFAVRAQAWLVLTVAAFVAPSFWLYAAVAAPVMLWATQRDPNPAALYLVLLFAVPHAEVPVPSVLVHELFDLSHPRLLALTLLAGTAWRLHRQRGTSPGLGDWLVVGYIVLAVGLMVPHDSATHSLRRVFLFCVDNLVLFYVFSRIRPEVGALRDVLGAWVMSGLLLAPVGVVETLRSWLLYNGIGDQWDAPSVFAYLLRGDLLRAQATTGHSLTLGYWLAMSWGFFLLLQRDWTSRWIRLLAGALLIAGLGAALSRGPWITAVLMTMVFMVLHPRGAGAAIKGVAAVTLALTLALASPVGEQIIGLLPFVGNVDAANVEYRQRLFETTLPLILANPIGGNPDVLSNLESLRQGQGIIDLVNGYILVALYYGLGGLALFAGLLLAAAARALAAWRHWRRIDEGAALCAASLFAAMAASIFFIATAGFGLPTYLLAGICFSVARMAGARQCGAAAVARQPLMSVRAPHAT